ncbi:hypothetical protein HPP92_001037 [Vanilla planifolia]|uniref:Uncharacterized protein n=1 Tax=Vanilla planifolia TaxID=51239 RepID=A0A835VH72_VANPL|nr:hypothetical protein HPP92_001037 [Vanilla planifolia]
MQTSKARNGSLELSAKKSPVTPKSSRASSSESDTAGSNRTPKKITIERSPKSINRQSPKSPLNEKKLPTKLNELECQISQLKEELKKAKDQLSLSESSKKQLEEEAGEIKKQLTATSSRLEESKLQLVEFSKAEDARLQELRKISQERDKAWQSELEALQQQHSIDSATLLSSMNEIQKLKQQIDMAMKAEADRSQDHDTAQIELDALKKDMAAALYTVQNLNAKVREKETAEEEAKNFISETQKQLEMANATIETLRTEGSDLFEYLNSTSSKLEESRVRVSALEEMVKELQADLESEDVEHRKLLHASDSGGTHSELVQLRAALEAAEARYQEEQIRNTMELQSAYEMAECVKVKAGMRETELGSTLGMAMSEISDLKVRLLDKETAVQSLSEMNKELNHKIEDEKANQFDSELKLMKATTDLTDLKARLLDKERDARNSGGKRFTEAGAQ